MSLIVTPDNTLKLTNRIVCYKDNSITNISISRHINKDCKYLIYTDPGDAMLMILEEPIYGERYSNTEWRFNLIGGHACLLFGNIIVQSENIFNEITVTIRYYDEQNNINIERYKRTYKFGNTTQETILLYNYIKVHWSSNGYISISIDNQDVNLNCQYIQYFNSSS